MEVVAAFKHRAQAQRAVDALLEVGFTPANLRLDWAEHAHAAFASEPDDPTLINTPLAIALVGFLGGAIATGVGVAFGLGKGGWWRVLPVALAGLALGGGAAAAYGYLSRSPAPIQQPATYDQGSLDRGHAVVTVATRDRILEVETLLRGFGGRAVHLRGEPAALTALH